MEWREQSSVSCEEAFVEAQRWIEAVTKKRFGSNDFRSALENGVLLCDLINRIKPGIVRRVNRLPTPIAGLDNLNVFLKACGKLGLKEAQLFHPGDLQDLSTRVTVKHQETDRRLKNVLITIYWLGRRAQCDRFYDGPYLNFKAFEGLLGTALYKALQDSSGQKSSNIRDSGFGDGWYPEREELYHLRGGGGHRRDDSLDSLDSLGSRPQSISSDATLKGSSEGCCSDTEADSVLRMAESKDSLSYRRSVTITPKAIGQFNQFLPTKDKQSGYVPAPLRKKRAERGDDSRRSWASISFVEDEGPLTRQHQAQESPDGSKSTSDIQADAAVARQIRYEELQKFREQIKDSEDKWQDDLSKWKNRRRSVNSDIVKKKEEREKIEQITYGGDRKSTTFKEIEEKRETKRQNSVGSRLGSLSYLDDNDDVFVKPTSSRTQTRPIRGYTIDSPYSSFEPPEPSLKTQELPPAVRPPSRPTSQEPEITNTSITPASRSSQPRATAPLQRSESVDTSRAEGTSSLLKAQEPRRTFLAPQSEPEAPSSVSLHKEAPLLSSMEPKPPGVSRVSASLPRSYQRSDSARITSVVTPRPFGTQSSRITSLPRAFTMDDSQKRVNGNADVPQKTSVPSRYHQYMTSEDEAQSSSAQSSEEEEEKKEMTTAKSISSVLPHVKSEVPISPAPAKEISQGNFCEMRLSLNQKPNSSRDFGFQAAWDSTGARVTSIQPGSPAEMCQLQTGDEVLTVNGHQVAEMSYTAWKSSLEEALQEGSLVMDVRRHGQNSSPETNPVSSSLDFTSRMSAETPPARAPPRHIVDVASNGVNGGLREEPVTMRNKESEPMSLKNLKRRSEFFEQGGSDSAMPDIPVPAITPSSSRWSWDPEAERKRQEKWQQEQERLLQEKYKRDQEKLHEEWLKAQQEIATSKGPQEVAKQSESLKMNSHISPQLPPSSVLEPRPSLWEEEEDEEEEERKRKEEKEKEHQRQVEERMKREEEERELQRLQEDRRRREMQEEEERMRREEEEEREEARRRQEAAEMERREKERAFQQQQWLKSKSSPQLDEEDKTQRRVTGSGLPDRKSQQSKSQAELERQQILNEMKKKTPLLTDSSWIRQRPPDTDVSKDSDVPPMRRGESLDNLDAPYNSLRSSWTPRSSSFAQNYSQPQSGSLSFYGGGSGVQRPVSAVLPSSYSTGSLRSGAGTHSSWPRHSPSLSPSSPSPATSPEPPSEAGGPQQRSRSVSGKKICTFCDTPLGKGAAMIIESLGLCYHLGCFKCINCKSDLGGSEAGAEVRIRSKQLYCNSCYIRVKTGQPTSM